MIFNPDEGDHIIYKQNLILAKAAIIDSDLILNT